MKELKKETVLIIVVVAVAVVAAIILYFMTRRFLVAQQANLELKKWNGKVETDESMYPTLVKYWAAAGFNWIDIDNIESYDDEYAWSAAFICWVVRKYYPNFPQAATHAKYTIYARDRKAAGKTSVVALEPSEHKPRPGDIIIKHRGYSGNLENLYESAKTHGDIVISNDGNTITAIGGNLGHTVKKVTVNANDGYLNSSSHFAVIKM